MRIVNGQRALGFLLVFAGAMAPLLASLPFVAPAAEAKSSVPDCPDPKTLAGELLELSLAGQYAAFDEPSICLASERFRWVRPARAGAGEAPSAKPWIVGKKDVVRILSVSPGDDETFVAEYEIRAARGRGFRDRFVFGLCEGRARELLGCAGMIEPPAREAIRAECAGEPTGSASGVAR